MITSDKTIESGCHPTVSITIPVEILTEIDAQRHKVNRSEYISTVVDTFHRMIDYRRFMRRSNGLMVGAFRVPYYDGINLPDFQAKFGDWVVVEGDKEYVVKNEDFVRDYVRCDQ